MIIPTIDTIIGKDANNPTNEDIKLLENDPYYATLVKTFIPLQYAANVYASYIASRKETSFLDKILIGISMGAVNGIAINTAHELSHKQDRIDHLLSHILLFRQDIIISALNILMDIINVLRHLKIQHLHKWARHFMSFGIVRYWVL